MIQPKKKTTHSLPPDPLGVDHWQGFIRNHAPLHFLPDEHKLPCDSHWDPKAASGAGTDLGWVVEAAHCTVQLPLELG